MRDVELRLVVEMAAIAFVAAVFAGPLKALYPSHFGIVLLPLLAALAWSLYKRWRVRRANWQLLSGYSGHTVGKIDTRDHYTVRWERFDAARALYLISQRDQLITVSTLAPNAPEILTNGLRVANYPCEEWPNLDL